MKVVVPATIFAASDNLKHAKSDKDIPKLF